ncbi:hypothetical protein MMC22_001282 [Lobaria immixta]|nr:hypothetical protein [Lobaria immixta]
MKKGTGNPEGQRSAPSNSNHEADSNPSRSIEGRDRVPSRSNFFDHEEPSEAAGDSDWLGGGDSTDHESDDVGSSETDESILSNEETPYPGLQDPAVDERHRLELEQHIQHRTEFYQARERNGITPEELARLEEYDRNVLEPHLRPRHARGHPPGDQAALEEPRPRPRRNPQRHPQGDQRALEEPRPRQRRARVPSPPRHLSRLLLEEPRPQQRRERVPSPPSDRLVLEEADPRQHRARAPSPSDRLTLEEPRPPLRRTRESSPSDQIVLEESRPRQRRKREQSPN